MSKSTIGHNKNENSAEKLKSIQNLNSKSSKNLNQNAI